MASRALNTRFHDDLLHLRDVGLYPSQVGIEIQKQIDVLAKGSGNSSAV